MTVKEGRMCASLVEAHAHQLFDGILQGTLEHMGQGSRGDVDPLCLYTYGKGCKQRVMQVHVNIETSNTYNRYVPL